MRKTIRNTLILLFPLFFMVIVNEYSRLQFEATDYQSRNQLTINSGSQIPEKCSWACHNDTSYCKTHHVKFNPEYFGVTDPLYFGMIASLRSLGNYGLANVLLLVIFFPLLIYMFLIKSLNIQDRINQMKKS
ncbi:hypothetical protein [Algoriphagus sp. A40]|uniref:hypothetical protein n=1 Tax=Algoriphagus sp. A40 TaxID=1945863 RepID=UPI0009862908|nr:hypothetical protein [Algoriphagus sp. A40]OOG77643.1 hypothetical protein B0E43_04405 [Algoriphagus sp. A40]